MSQIERLPELKPLSIAETLRVMDVASEIRRQQELVESEFHAGELKAKLRESLRAASAQTGEEISENQIEQAIAWYYDHLHKYRSPKSGLRTFFAHLYIRRGLIFGISFLILFLVGGGWLAWRSIAGLLF